MADIAINPVTRRVQFTGNTGTGPFAFTFNVLQASDIVVYKNNVLQILTTDYTVSLNVNGTGSVTMTSALVETDVLIIVGGRELSRTTDFVTSGDLLAASLNEQLDSNVIMSQQLDERISRAIRAQPGDELTDLYIPLKSARADKLLSFDPDGNVTAQSPSAFFSGSILGANYVNDTFTGDGVTTVFTTSTEAGSKNNIQIYIDGVYQNKSTFELSELTLTFSEAPPLGASIEAIIGNALPSGVDVNATNVNYRYPGTSTTRTLAAKLGEMVSVKDFGAVGDGVTDDTAAFTAALAAYDNILVPAGTYIVTDTITVGRNGKNLIGEVPAMDSYGTKSVIKYNGTASNTKTVIKFGWNEVGAEPQYDGTNNSLINLVIDANNRAGFCVYGTYVTNDSIVRDCAFKNSLEFNAYFARSWYATFQNIVSYACRGKGLAFGMPLILQDGTNYSGSWITAAPLELNETMINNVRSENAGTYYSVDNTGTYDPTSSTHRMQGYGIGFGIGNGLAMTNFLSEGSGGVNLYVYRGPQPVGSIQYGYLENSMKNSGLNTSTEMASIIIETLSGYTNSTYIRDIFSNYSSGGIYHTGTLAGSFWLENIHQPRFLKSLDGASAYELYAHVLKRNVRYECGYHNTAEGLMSPSGYGVVNTRYSFTVNLLPGSHHAIYIKYDNTAYYGSYYVNFDDGTSVNRSFGTLTTAYQLNYVSDGGAISITKGGGTGGTDNQVTFKVMVTPSTTSG